MTRPTPTETSRSPLSRPVAFAVVLLGAAFVFLRMTPGLVEWNLVPLGALALFSAARLRGVWAFAIPVGLRLVTDLVVWGQFDFVYPPFDPFTYAALAVTLYLGVRLRRTPNPLWIGGMALGSSVAFFLVTNFGAWVMQAMPYPRTAAGLLLAYEQGLPFFRPQLFGELLGVGLLFASHAALASAYSRSELPRPAGAEA